MKTPIIEVKNLTKTFKKGANIFTAVDSVTFRLMPGECLGLVGESGCGKSTLAKLITHLEKPDSGQIFLEGRDITYVKGKALREIYGKIQMVFQDAVSSFNGRMRIGDSIMEVLGNFGTATLKERQEKMLYLLDLVGLKGEYARRFPHQLSGGECQRAAIARAIAVQPKVLICDEATSALDVSVQAQVLMLLEHIRKEMNISFLFISHDLAVVNCLCEKIGVMHHGRIVEMGFSQDIINRPKHHYTKSLLASVLYVTCDDESQVGTVLA